MLEIYVLKLCVVSFEGTLPCRVENALISKKARAVLSEAAPTGAESPRRAREPSNQGLACC